MSAYGAISTLRHRITCTSWRNPIANRRRSDDLLIFMIEIYVFIMKRDPEFNVGKYLWHTCLFSGMIMQISIVILNCQFKSPRSLKYAVTSRVCFISDMVFHHFASTYCLYCHYDIYGRSSSVDAFRGAPQVVSPITSIFENRKKYALVVWPSSDILYNINSYPILTFLGLWNKILSRCVIRNSNEHQYFM